MPTMYGQQHPLSSINSCFWNIWNFVKWRIALEPTTPRYGDNFIGTWKRRMTGIVFLVCPLGSEKNIMLVISCV